jgi:hypothetical protein
MRAIAVAGAIGVGIVVEAFKGKINALFSFLLGAKLIVYIHISKRL